MALVFLLYALFATVFIICKSALEYTEPLFLVGSRMAVAGGLMLSYQLWADRQQFALIKEHAWKLFALAFFNIYLTNACEIWGLQYLSSAKTCFIYSLSPFFAALLSFWFFEEVVSKRKWVGLLIGFIGFYPLIMDKGAAEELAGSFWLFSWAEMAVTVAALSSVYGWILLKQVVSSGRISFLTANGVSMLLGGLIALVHSAAVEGWDPVPVSSWAPFIQCTLLLLIVSNLLAYNLYGFLLKRYSATFVSFAGFTTPLFTAALGWYFFGDQVTASFMLSALVVFCGLYLFYQEELEREELPTAVVG
jgi:drug/metabolite transporter (DMT)-like permease